MHEFLSKYIVTFDCLINVFHSVHKNEGSALLSPTIKTIVGFLLLFLISCVGDYVVELVGY